MKNLLLLSILAILPVTSFAVTVTGNLGNWNGVDGEGLPLGWAPIFQGVTIPDPGPGLRWQIDDLSFAAIAQRWWGGEPASNTTGFRAWLIPGGPLVHNQPYVDNRASAVAYFEYHHGGQLPQGRANAIPVTVDINSPGLLLAGGIYYLEIAPLAEDLAGGNWSYLAVGRDGGANSYAGGQEAYYQWGNGTIGVNANHDLVFAIGGTAVVKPEVIIEESNGVTLVSESGTADSYTVVLGTQPTEQVTIIADTNTADPQIQVSTGGGPWSSQAQLDFTTSDWNQPQTIDVKAIDDSVEEITTWPPNTHQSTITHTSYSSDLNYMNPDSGGTMTVAPVIVDIEDNDFPCGEAGMEFLEGDLNEDCRVDFNDFAILGSQWTQSNLPEQPEQPAVEITGNLGSWNGSDGEALPNAVFPIFENVTMPDPGAGMGWDIDSLSFQAVAQNWWGGSSGNATGFRAWLLPGTLTDGGPYTQKWPAETLAYFEYHHGGPLPQGYANAIPVTIANSAALLVAGGSYYLEIRPLAAEEWSSYLAIGRDGGANSYAGGAEGYFQIGSTVGINANHDLVFAIKGSAKPSDTNTVEITGNLSGWNGTDGEGCPRGLFPVFQNITLPDPCAGEFWKLNTLKFAAIAENWWGDSPGGTSSGFQVWIRPGTLAQNQPYDTEMSDAVAYAKYVGPVPSGAQNAIPVTIEFDYSSFIAGGNYYLELRPLDEDIVGGDVSYIAFGRDGGANSYAGGAEGYYQYQTGTVGINANHDLVFAIEGSSQAKPAGGATVPMPEDDPNRVQVYMGNVIDFTPAVYEITWKMNNDMWAVDGNIHREFEGEAYTYNDNYVTQNGSLTTAWCESDYPGVGGIVWHFKADDPNYIESNGGMKIDISSVYGFASVDIYGTLQPGGNIFEIYYSDVNDFNGLITDYNVPPYNWNYEGMTGGVWEGPSGNPPSGYTGTEYNSNWQLAYSGRRWGGSGFYLAEPNSVISADGNFWVRLDAGVYSADLFYERPTLNNLGNVRVPELEVKGRYNWPQTCGEVWDNGEGMPGDINQDCVVDMRDMGIFADMWLKCNDPQNSQCTPNW